MNPLLELVNRDNAHGAYTEDGQAFTKKEAVTEELLNEHVSGKTTIGLYTTNPITNTCKWGAIDIDAEDLNLEKTLNAAIVIHDILLTDYAVRSWTNFSGRKGFHVWFKCYETDASWVFNLLTEVRRKAEERLGYKIGGENYPKQPHIPADGYGNWIKLPLGIHPKTGNRCLLVNPKTKGIYSLEDSIKVIKEAPINDIPMIGTPFIAKEYENVKVERSTEEKPVYWKCFQKLISNGESEGNRHYAMMVIVHQCWANGLSIDRTRELLHEFNQNCKPTKPPEEIDRELRYQWERCEKGRAYKIGCQGQGIISQVLTKHCPFANKEACLKSGKMFAIAEKEQEEHEERIDFDALIKDLKENSAHQKIEDVIKKVAFLPELDRNKRMGEIHNATKQPKKSLNNILKKYYESRFSEKSYSPTNISPIQSDIQEASKFEEALRGFTDYIDLARRFVGVQPICYTPEKIWWLWEDKDKRWRMVDDIDIMNLIDKGLEKYARTTPQSVKAEIIEALKRIGRQNTPKEMPLSWIQFKDEIYDLETGALFEPTPEYFCTNPIPWELGESEETPNIDRIFTEWVGPDLEWVSTLKEECAYCLYRGYPIQRLAILIGDGSNGKSTFQGGFLLKFLGKENIYSTTLDRLIKNTFEVANLHRKLLVLIGEMNIRIIERTDLLKRLTGGDPVAGELKGKSAFWFVNYAKVMGAANLLPDTTDKSLGYFRRQLCIDFPYTFSEKKDVLAEIPEHEYRNFARQCLRILKDLLERRSFTKDGTIEERKQRYVERSSPLTKFIENEFVKSVNERIPFQTLYAMIQEQVEDNVFFPVTKKSVSKLLQDGFGCQIKQMRGMWNKESVNCSWVIGLGLPKKTPLEKLKEIKARGIRIISRGDPQGMLEAEIEKSRKNGWLNEIEPNRWEIVC